MVTKIVSAKNEGSLQVSQDKVSDREIKYLKGEIAKGD